MRAAENLHSAASSSAAEAAEVEVEGIRPDTLRLQAMASTHGCTATASVNSKVTISMVPLDVVHVADMAVVSILDPCWKRDCYVAR